MICFLDIIALSTIATVVILVYIVTKLSKHVQDSNPKVVTVTELCGKVKDFNLIINMLDLKEKKFSSNMISKIAHFQDLIKLTRYVSNYLKFLSRKVTNFSIIFPRNNWA